MFDLLPQYRKEDPLAGIQLFLLEKHSPEILSLQPLDTTLFTEPGNWLP
jgi:hypothetical protein